MNIPLRRGMLIRHQNHVYQVVDFQERHTGKQRPTVHVALRDVRDGHPVDRTLSDLEPVQEVAHATRNVQYLYARGDVRVFMDAETFDEFALTREQLKGQLEFLREGETYRVTFLEERPFALDLPEVVRLQVSQTAPPTHSVGNAASVMKEATLENDLLVRVPLFIKMGDTIRVDTRTRTYVGKE